MSTILSNATSLLNWILNSILTMFSNNSPIAIGISNTLTNMGITPTVAIIQNVNLLIFCGLFIIFVSFAVGIFLRIAGSR